MAASPPKEKDIDPGRYESISDYLTKGLKFNFSDANGRFEKNDVKIPVEEIAGHTVQTFAEKMRRRGWDG